MVGWIPVNLQYMPNGILRQLWRDQKKDWQGAADTCSYDMSVGMCCLGLCLIEDQAVIHCSLRLPPNPPRIKFRRGGRGLLLRSEWLLVPTFLCLTSDRWGSYPWTMDVPVLCWCCRGTLNGGLDTSEPAVYAKWHSETTLA